MKAEVVILPPVSIVQGAEFYQEFAYEDATGVIDLTDWHLSASLSDRPFDAPFWRGTIESRADGVLRLHIPKEVTAGFAAQPRLGGAPSAVLQVRLDAPVDEFSQVWQGPAIIAGVFP